MNETSSPRDELARELGGALPALDGLTQDQCADLRDLLAQATRRDRELAAAELEVRLVRLPRLYRPVVRGVFLGWRR